MGAKFIHPIESACPKKPVAIRNTTATIMRRSAGIISQNLSARYDMQRQIWERPFQGARLQRSKQIRDSSKFCDDTASRIRGVLRRVTIALRMSVRVTLPRRGP